MRILIVGNGGREHALAWKIRQSPLVRELFCAPGNAGIAEVADCVPIEGTHIVELADFAQQIGAALTVVGPELPAVLGIVDEFQRRGLPIFGPTRAAAELEGSKVFAREFMQRHGIPAPRFALARSLGEAEQAISAGGLGWPLVVKMDGLAAGKGVVVAADAGEALAAAGRMLADGRGPGARLVLEEFLPGEELSFLALSDGSRVVPLVSAQDHKRALDGDQGPNTGGMGTVSPATQLTVDLHKQIMQEIVVPTVAGMAAEGRRYQGVLYAGLMLTPAGPRVLEFNCRFGDPEAQVILARLKSDVVPLLQGVAAGQLPEARPEWAREAAACVVMASRGYPDTPDTGQVVTGLDRLKPLQDVIAFHAATARRDGKLVTVGGRVLGVTALGANLAAAVRRAYEAVALVSFDGAHYRRDIGQRALARLQSPEPAPGA